MGCLVLQVTSGRKARRFKEMAETELLKVSKWGGDSLSFNLDS